MYSCQTVNRGIIMKQMNFKFKDIEFGVKKSKTAMNKRKWMPYCII